MFCEKQLVHEPYAAELQIDAILLMVCYKSAYLVPRQMRKLRLVPVQAGHIF